MVFPLAACGSGGGSSKGGSADKPLVVSTPYLPQGWDPAQAPAAPQEIYQFLVYDRLVHLAADGSYQPGLASSWDIEDAGKSLVLHLRPGVKFQDGETFDAAAVKANIQRGQTLDGSTEASALAPITTITVVDPETVRLDLKDAEANLLVGQFTGFAGEMIAPKSLTDPDLANKPVGAGMFKLTNLTQDTATLQSWSGYWDPSAVKVKQIVYKGIQDETTRWNAVKTGDVDVAMLTDPSLYKQVEGTSGVKAQIKPTLIYANWGQNRTRSPYDNLLVRQAMMYAIDRQAISDSVFFGYSEPTVQPFPEGSPAHVELPADTYAYDPAKAK